MLTTYTLVLFLVGVNRTSIAPVPNTFPTELQCMNAGEQFVADVTKTGWGGNGVGYSCLQRN